MASEITKKPNKWVRRITWPIRRFRRFGRVGKVITLVIIALLVYWRYSAYQNGGIEVETAKVGYGKLVESVDASGEVAADKAANLAFQTAGEVEELNFKEGDEVKKGDIIAKLDTTILYDSYLTAEATLRAAQASLDSVYDQVQGHENDETFAQRSTRTTAETTKDKAYWAFVTASKNLNGAYIKAPFDGILTQVPDNIYPGAYVSVPTTATFQVTGPETTYFQAEVNEADIYKFTSGAKADITLDAYPDEILGGQVYGLNFVSVTTSTGGTAYKVQITLPENKDLKYKVGMNGDAEVILTQKDHVLTIPINATVEEGDKTYVWIVENKHTKKAEVETGISSTNDIEVVSGLSENGIVVVRPPNEIQEGSKVKIK
jgi:RND family efflux transporter MFP subunit